MEFGPREPELRHQDHRPQDPDQARLQQFRGCFHRDFAVQGERFGFRRTDGSEFWAIRFGPAGLAACDGPCDVELYGTASDLMLFLWQRAGPGTGSLAVRGDAALLDRYFVLVPPL